jgi:hypothetical protein
MKKIILLIVLIFTFTINAQVQRSIEGKSIIRENIKLNNDFNFFRDWSKTATFKSGIGETVELFPIVFSTPDKKIELYGLQLDAEVKPQEGSIAIRNSSGMFTLNKNFI